MANRPINFILTADDYGISPVIDDAIEEGIKLGYITSVAAFANIKNGDRSFTAKKAARLRKIAQDAGKEISLGLHFTITCGERVSDEATSLSPKNRFRFKGPGKQAVGFGGVKEDHLKAELQAQLDVFINSGIRDIDHFSDHQGLISHTSVGIRAIAHVVGTYNKHAAKPASYRNPMFMSSLIRDRQNCLHESEVIEGNLTPIALQWILNLRKKPSRFILTRDSIREKIKELHQAGIPTTDFFVESLYNADDFEKKVACIFDQKNYPNPVKCYKDRMRDDVYLAEVMVHIAKRKPTDQAGKKAYEEGIDMIEDYRRIKRGVDIKYVRNKRPKERLNLLAYIGNHHPPIVPFG